MKTKFSLFLMLLLLYSMHSFSQITYTADTKAGVYNGDFLYGSNMAWRNNWWSDGDVADILVGNPDKGRVGVGANSLRPALFHYFVEKYGYESRIPFFEHYTSIGAKNNVVFIGDRPSEALQEDAYYCTDADGNILKTDENGYSLKSKLYKNMYEPIWIDGENGEKVINENNYYAHYVYRVVSLYKDHCLFYEIINEPDFTHTGVGNRNKGEADNWYENDPKPKDLKNLYAPIERYVRILRISYEVIKTLQPDALVCIGGIGYNGFLDAVLRKTDNPDGGKVSEEYQHMGGAWFDCLSYHLYPMYFLREWVGRDTPGNIDGFRHYRHSDAAVEYTLDKQKTLEKVLSDRGYGVTYPRKEIILTETNVPNKQVKTYLGGETVQCNFLLKLAILGQKTKLRGLYPFAPWDDKEQHEDGGEYEYKGFYFPTPEKPTEGELRMHESGTGWRTMSTILGGKAYNDAETQKLALSDSIDGAVFGEGDSLVYALWAKTSIDLSEAANAEYTFQGDGIKSLTETAASGNTRKINGAKALLTGNVLFFQIARDSVITPEPEETDNANTVPGIYNGDFLYGSNMAWRNNWWSDADVADILVGNPDKGRIGVGANSLRPALFHYFVEKYGYESRLPFFQHYAAIGAKTNVVFIGDRPSEDLQEDAFYCTDANGNILKVDENGYSLKSKLYKNMYEPIWIVGENGEKVINENNYYAHYVYRVVSLYKDYCQFYEIMNEPDFTHTGVGNRGRGEADNWYENDPKAKDLKNLFAPVERYVRLLRISYDVIKTLQPDALVCIGGIGYDGFLDAVLRKTDNPDGGKVSEEYQYMGGAWFDCLSYHLYPMYFLREWVGRDTPGNIDGFRHYRHSDAAVEYTLKKQQSLETILTDRGYGVTYPRKEVIITETNVPNKQVKTYIGGEKTQNNYLMKLAVLGQKSLIRGVYPFAPWDDKEHTEEGGEYEYKGFYFPTPEKPNEGKLRMHESATGWRIMSSVLGGKDYNAVETQKMEMPENMDGAAFGEGNDLIYALWAKTSKDLSEVASVKYVFKGTGVKHLIETRANGNKRRIYGNNVTLSGDVAFYEVNGEMTKTAAALSPVMMQEEVDPQSALDAVKIYTLGNDNKVYVESENAIQRIEIYDFSRGQLLYSKKVDSAVRTVSSDAMLQGIYVVRVILAEGTVSEKIAVQ